MRSLLFINSFLFKYIFFYRYIFDYAWIIGEIVFIILWIFLIKYRKISGQKTALVAFSLLGITMVCNILGFDTQAGMIAEYVFILFCISFGQEFYYFLKHEKI